GLSGRIPPVPALGAGQCQALPAARNLPNWCAGKRHKLCSLSPEATPQDRHRPAPSRLSPRQYVASCSLCSFLKSVVTAHAVLRAPILYRFFYGVLKPFQGCLPVPYSGLACTVIPRIHAGAQLSQLLGKRASIVRYRNTELTVGGNIRRQHRQTHGQSLANSQVVAFPTRQIHVNISRRIHVDEPFIRRVGQNMQTLRFHFRLILFCSFAAKQKNNTLCDFRVATTKRGQ